MNDIKAVILDLDDTLYPEIDYFLQIFSSYAATRNYIGDIQRLFLQGIRFKSKDILGDILKELSIYSNEKHDELFEVYCNCHVEITLDWEAEKLLKWLKENKIKTGILTNGVVAVQKNKVSHLNLNKYVDKIVYARNCSVEKPNPAAFKVILDKLGVESQECVFIGDNEETDIKGAQQVGMTAYHYVKHHNYGNFKLDVPRVHSFAEIFPEILN